MFTIVRIQIQAQRPPRTITPPFWKPTTGAATRALTPTATPLQMDFVPLPIPAVKLSAPGGAAIPGADSDGATHSHQPQHSLSLPWNRERGVMKIMICRSVGWG